MFQFLSLVQLAAFQLARSTMQPGDLKDETAALIPASPGVRGGGVASLGEAQQAATERAQSRVLAAAVALACVGGLMDVLLTPFGLNAAGWAVCTAGALLLLTIGDLDLDTFFIRRPLTKVQYRSTVPRRLCARCC